MAQLISLSTPDRPTDGGAAELQRQHHLNLTDAAGGLRLDWQVDDAAASVRFTLTNPFADGRPYFALGFTKWGVRLRSDRVQFHRSLGRLVVEVGAFSKRGPRLVSVC